MKIDWKSSTVGDIQYFTYVSSVCDIQVSSFKAVNGKTQANIDRFDFHVSSELQQAIAFATLSKALLCRPASVHINVTDGDDNLDKDAANFWQHLVHKLPTRDGIIIVDAPTLKQIVGRHK